MNFGQWEPQLEETGLSNPEFQLLLSPTYLKEEETTVSLLELFFMIPK